MPEDGKLMKIGLIVAAAIIVIRIILEQAGAPLAVNYILGVAWLYFIMPALFAISIRAFGHARPFGRLLRDVVLFAVFTRLMVAVTYVLAYYLEWDALRFSEKQGGTVGENITPLNGILLIPLRNAIIWIVMATILGIIIGAIALAVKRKRPEGTVNPA